MVMVVEVGGAGDGDGRKTSVLVGGVDTCW